MLIQERIQTLCQTQKLLWLLQNIEATDTGFWQQLTETKTQTAVQPPHLFQAYTPSGFMK